MSILTKPYTITVWRDEWDTTNKKFVEKRIGIIGTDKMTAQCRALEPTLTRNVNGVKKFSFQMYTQYIDNETGEKTKNPYIDWLVSERKVKLEYNNKWYDFVIKDISENSATFLNTYSLEDALVQELSKNGFGVTLDAELMNNSGTAEELANFVLADTDWKVESETFVEVVEESLVYLKVETNISAIKLKNSGSNFLSEGLAEESKSLTASAGNPITILAFYSSCRNKPHRFQFIYLEDFTDIRVNSDRKILNDDCQYYCEYNEYDYTEDSSGYGFYLPSGFSVCSVQEVTDDPKSITVISNKYRGGRYGFAQKAVYVPLLERYCQVYQNGNKYGFVENHYADPVFMTNLVSNTEFESTSGWTGTYLENENDQKDKATVENVYGKFVGGNFVSTTDYLKDKSASGLDSTLEDFLDGKSNTGKCKPYLKVTLTGNNSLILNSGPYDNRRLIGNMSAGKRYAFRPKVLNSSGVQVYPFEYDIGQYIYDPSSGGYEKENVITFNYPFANEGNYAQTDTSKEYYIYQVVSTSFENEKDFIDNSKIKIAIKAKDNETINKTYYIETFEFFEATFDSSGKVIPLTEQGSSTAQQGVISQIYKFFNKDQLNTVSTKEELVIEEYDSLYKQVWNNTKQIYEPNGYRYTPVYNNKGEKVRSVSGKESNYFNILQSIAETFKCWLELVVDRNSNGAILSKKVKLKNYVGGKNYAAFRYGVNLKDIQRTHSSKNIVTKLMVKQNNNQHGKDGFCTIQRANANPTGESYIYDFQYFQNMGLMDANEYVDLLYKIGLMENSNSSIGVDMALLDDWEISYKNSTVNSDQWETKREPNDDCYKIKQHGSSIEEVYAIDYCSLQGYFPRLRAINDELQRKNKIAINAAAELRELNAQLSVQTARKNAALSGLEEAQEDYYSLTGNLPGGGVNYGCFVLDEIDNYYAEPANEREGHIVYNPSFDIPGGTLSKLAFQVSQTNEEPKIKIRVWAAYPKEGNGSESQPGADTVTVQMYPILYDKENKRIGSIEVSTTLTICEHLTDPNGEQSGEGWVEVPLLTTSSSIEEKAQKYLEEYATCLQQKIEATREETSLNALITAKRESYEDLAREITWLQEAKSALNKLFFSKYSRFIQEGTWIDEQYYDDEKYYIDALSVMYNSCYPQVAYTINTNEVSKLEGYKDFTFELGEETYAEDGEFFGYEQNGTPKRISVIISEKTENLDDPTKDINKCQNFKNQFQDLFQKITATTQQVQYNSGAYEQGAALAKAITDDSVSFLTDTLASMTANLSDPDLTSESYDKSSYLQIVDGKVLIGKKDVNTEEVSWRTGLSSSGISASLITSGMVDTGVVQIMYGNDPVFKWDWKGITAYDYKNYDGIISGINESKFVRFDKYGLYGVNGSVLNGWTPNSTKEVSDKAAYYLTWDGLALAPQNILYTNNDEFEGSKPAPFTAKLGRVDDLIFNEWDNTGVPWYNSENKSSPKFVKVFSVGDKVGGNDAINEQFVLYSDGTLVTNNIKFTGGIEWTEMSSPSKNVYAKTALAKPLDNTRFNNTNFPKTNSSTTDESGNTTYENRWHQLYNDGKSVSSEEDFYYCHTDNGGATWQGPFLITGRSIVQTIIEYALISNNIVHPANYTGKWENSPSSLVADGGNRLCVRMKDEYNNGEYSAWRYFIGTSPTTDLTLTASALVVQEDQDGNLSPETITLTAIANNLPNANWEWDGKNVEKDDDESKATFSTEGMQDSNTITVTYGNYSDSVTIIKVKEGSDAISVLLTNPTMVFNRSETDAKEVTYVHVFRGAEKVSYTNNYSNSGFDWAYELSTDSKDVEIGSDGKITVTNPRVNTSLNITLKLYKGNKDTHETKTLTINCSVLTNLKITLSNDRGTVVTDKNGDYGGYSDNVKTTAWVFDGGIEVTDQWTFDAQSSLIPGSTSEPALDFNNDVNVFQIKDMKGDSAVLSITAKKTGEPPLTIDFPISKLKQGRGAISCYVDSSAGELFLDTSYDEDDKTTLTARIFEDEEEIDAKGEILEYHWYLDGAEQTEWRTGKKVTPLIKDLVGCVVHFTANEKPQS